MDYSDQKETLGVPQLAEVGPDFDLPPEKAGTIYDQRDMERVGKKQELRVHTGRNAYTPCLFFVISYVWTAKLPLHFHLGLHCCTDVYL